MATSSEDTIALLQRVPVFAALVEEELARIAEVTVPRRFEAGEVVFKNPDDALLLLRWSYGNRKRLKGLSIDLGKDGSCLFACCSPRKFAR